MNRSATWRLSGAALILLVAAACTPASDQGTAEQELCDSLATFGDSVQAIADFDPATDSIEDLQADAQAADDAWTQVEADAAGVEAADEAALGAAWSALSLSITNLPTDVPVQEAKDTITSSVDEVQSVYTEMRDGLNCE